MGTGLKRIGVLQLTDTGRYAGETGNMRKADRSIVCVGFAAILFLLLFAEPPQAISKVIANRVLFISSHHPGLPTFFQQIEGIKSAFSTETIVLDIEFMDSERFYDDTNLDNFHNSLSCKLSQSPAYDLIITADDNALSFATEHQQELFAGLPIIFFGVNDIDVALAQNANPEVTGVIEAVSMLDTLRLIEKLHPDTRNITALVDSTAGGQGDLQTFYRLGRELDGIDLSEISLMDLSFDEFAAQLRRLPNNTNVLLLSAFRDKSGNSLRFDASLQMIRKNLPRPIYHLWFHGMGNGILGGKLIDHFDQALAAGKIALEVLNGRPVEDMVVRTETRNRYIFDYIELKRFGIDRDDLPENSSIINNRLSFYEEQERTVWSLAAVFAALIAFLLVLSLYTSRRRHAAKALQKHQDHLENLVEERTAELTDSTSAFKDSEERFRSLSDAAFEGIIISEEDTILEANNTMAEMFGYERSEVIGMKATDFTTPAYRDLVSQNVVSSNEKALEFMALRKDGSIFEAESHGRAIPYEGRTLRVTAIRDISDRKQAEDRLRLIHRMESIGTLAGGIAHDFNNLLSVIVGYTELAKDGIEPGSDISEYLAEATNASFLAQELTKRLIAFSEGGTPAKEIGSVGEFLEEIANEALSGSNITPEFSLPQALWPVDFDPGQIKHAIRNLILNSVEAMPNGGFIRIQADNFEAGSEAAQRGLPLPEGRYVKILIRDQGIGIPEESLSKIFDPYFSTKEMGAQKGMGFGLATTYSIISQHAGHIDVESEVDVHTTFTIYLPAHEEDIEVFEPGGITSLESPTIRTRRVLVMDDEEMMRKLARYMLTQFGYDTELAKDGTEAIRLYKEALGSARPFETIILDLTVKGGMGGEAAIRSLLGMDPRVKAIISSGYTSHPIMIDFKKYGFSGALPKPYTADDLRDLLNSLHP